MKKIYMLRSDGRLEDLKTRENLVRVLVATSKKAGNPLRYAQCGAIATNIMSGKTKEFCGRLFEVREEA